MKTKEESLKNLEAVCQGAVMDGGLEAGLALRYEVRHAIDVAITHGVEYREIERALNEARGRIRHRIEQQGVIMCGQLVKFKHLIEGADMDDVIEGIDRKIDEITN